MNGKIKRRIWQSVRIFLLIYICGGVILYSIQDMLLFHPIPLPKEHHFSFDQPFEELNIPIGTDNLSLVKFHTNQPRKGIVLFFHGNRYNVEHYKKYPALFLQHGYDLWMIDYPGFGKTTGVRSEQNIYNDALLTYELAQKEVHNDSIIIYGKSIGTGVAAQLASIKPAKQLILETPYYSIDALAKHYFPIYPVLPMTQYSFPIYDYLKKVTYPVTMFHGTKDEVIPYEEAQELSEENKQIELITIPGGKHNTLYGFALYQQKMDSLLKL
jgi:hypothetical protein